MAQLSRGLAHGLEVGGAFYEGLAHCIHTLLEGKFEAFAIALRERANTEINARQVQSFSRTQFAASPNFTGHLISFDFRHFELQVTIIERDDLARFYHLGQAREADGDASLISHDFFSCERKSVAGLQLDRLLA